RRLPATTNPGVCAFPGTQGLCGPGGRVDHGDDSWPQAGTCASHPGSIADRLAHVEALAAMVAGYLFAQLLLESRPSPVHASGVRANAAFIVVVEFSTRGTRPPAGCLTVSEADNRPRCLERACYVRAIPTPAEDAGRQSTGISARSRTSPKRRT